MIRNILSGLRSLQFSGQKARRRKSANRSFARAAIIETLEPRIVLSMDHGLMLVPVAQATVTAVASGQWDDPAVWNGNMPADGDRVHRCDRMIDRTLWKCCRDASVSSIRRNGNCL